MRVARTADFMRLCVDLIYSALNNCLILLLSTWYIKYPINSTGKYDKSHNDKEDENKYLINEVLEKFNRTIITYSHHYKLGIFPSSL